MMAALRRMRARGGVPHCLQCIANCQSPRLVVSIRSTHLAGSPGDHRLEPFQPWGPLTEQRCQLQLASSTCTAQSLDRLQMLTIADNTKTPLTIVLSTHAHLKHAGSVLTAAGRFTTATTATAISAMACASSALCASTLTCAWSASQSAWSLASTRTRTPTASWNTWRSPFSSPTGAPMRSFCSSRRLSSLALATGPLLLSTWATRPQRYAATSTSPAHGRLSLRADMHHPPTGTRCAQLIALMSFAAKHCTSTDCGTQPDSVCAGM